MRSLTRGRPAGFTLLETTIALAVLGVAMLGALAAVNNSNAELRAGQFYFAKATLADQAIQRARLTLKSSITPWADSSSLPDQVAIGTDPPWHLDPSGAYFVADGTGTYRAADPAEVAAGTLCNAVPAGILCREIAWTTGVPYNAFPTNSGLDASMHPITLWVRVSRMGEPSNLAVLQREVFLQ